jgi:hypothetical protein
VCVCVSVCVQIGGIIFFAERRRFLTASCLFPSSIFSLFVESGAFLCDRTYKYLERLQARSGFRCSVVRNYSAFYDAKSAFSGFSGMVNRFNACSEAGSSTRCECDLAVSAFALSSVRLAKVDYVAAFSDDNYRVLTSRALVKSTASNKLFFFKTFSWTVWIGIATLLVTHVFVTSMDSNFAPPRGDSEPAGAGVPFFQRFRRFLLKNPYLFRFRHALFNSLFHMVGQTVDVDTHKSGTKEKIMNLLALVIGIFLLTIFQASVTFQVLLDEPRSSFRSSKDFKSCKISPDRVCLLATGASRTFWDLTIAPSPYVTAVVHNSYVIIPFLMHARAVSPHHWPSMSRQEHFLSPSLLNLRIGPGAQCQGRSFRFHSVQLCSLWFDLLTFSSFSWSLVVLYRCIANNPSNSPKIVDSFESGFQNVRAGTCDYFFTLGGQILWQVNGRYCNSLMAVGKPFFHTSVGFVLPKNSNLTDFLTLDTLRLRQENQLINSTQYASRFTCNIDSNFTLVSFSRFPATSSCTVLHVVIVFPC